MLTKTEPRYTSLFAADGSSVAGNVTFTFDDRTISAPAGVSIAAALLLNGIERFRATPVTSAPRAPFCMMGVCFDCLVEIDGMPSRQACLSPVREGMVVKPQEGASALALAAEGAEHGR